ncbi:MAG: diguanylate cyclase [Lachnospiraceae bacterium]|nr:diguanylate cyclase [Lachnospiraceae bacterium]
MENKKFVSLITKFATVFTIFTVFLLIINGLTIYYNQVKIDTETRLTHMQQINTYFDSLITQDGETFKAYQELMLKYKDELKIPIDVEGFGEAETDFYASFYDEYPGMEVGEDISYYDMSEELQKKFVIYQHEYWLYMFEQARPDMNLIYTYYVVPGKDEDEDWFIYWLIDGVREPSKAVGEEYMNLCDGDTIPPETGHDEMWYALNTGLPSRGYDKYDNEYGKTYACYRPIVMDGEVLGAVVVEVEIASVNEDILKSTARQVFYMAVVLIIAVTLMLVYINRRYVKRIKFLSGKVKQYADSKGVEVSEEIENAITVNDELSQLAGQTAAMMTEIDEHIRNIFITMNELDRTKKQAKELDVLAKVDSLTGIKNKTAYDEIIEDLEWALSEGETNFGIAVADLNYLKKINDTHGHDKGDLALKKICRIICNAFKHSPVFRIGGDEFTIVFTGYDYEHAESIVEKFKSVLDEIASDSSLEPWEKVSAAIGYAKYDPAKDSHVDDVFKRADASMYEDKRAMKAERN